MAVWITHVKPKDIPSTWPYVRNHIARACQYADGTLAAPDVLARLLAGEMMLWLMGDKACACTEVIRYPQSLTVRIPIIGGAGMRDWLKPFLATVEAWAKSIGADRMEGCGRKGWSRVADYKTVAHVVSKKL